MLNVYCWRCGTKVGKDDILGLGHFDERIGKYRGKGFVAFNCSKCQKARYQILDPNVVPNYLNQYFNKSSGNEIQLDQVIDFYLSLKNIETVEGFLKQCGIATTTLKTKLEKTIVQPLDVYNLFRELNNSNMRRLLVLTLDDNNHLLSWEFSGEGLARPVSFEPRDIFRSSFLLEDKTGVIIAHNLNQDYSQPTQKDILMTRRLIKAGKILGVKFLDHIVIEEDGFYSYDQLNYI